MIEENHEKTSVRLVGTGIWTRDRPNSSLVLYHGATSLGKEFFYEGQYLIGRNIINLPFIALFKVELSYKINRIHNIINLND